MTKSKTHLVNQGQIGFGIVKGVTFCKEQATLSMDLTVADSFSHDIAALKGEVCQRCIEAR